MADVATKQRKASRRWHDQRSKIDRDTLYTPLEATRLMKELGVTGGFRHVINTGPDGGQEVYHLHLHVMGGPRPWLKG